MSGPFPQFEETQPIIKPQKVANKSQGYEEFAKTLQEISGAAAEKAISIEKEESKTMFINSVSNVEQLKDQTKVKMLQNPGMASEIAHQSKEALETVDAVSRLNRTDRARLKHYITGTGGSLDVKAAQMDLDFNNREAAFSHFVNLPDKFKAYQETLLTDHDKAEHLHQAMVDSLHGLVSTGALKPYQAAAEINAMKHIVDHVQKIHDAVGGLDTDLAAAGYNGTAKDFHTLMSSPLTGASYISPMPTNQTTQWGMDYYNSDRSLQGMKAAVRQHQLPDPETFMSAKPHARAEIIQEIQGVKIADGYLKSGEPFPSIQRTYKALSEKGRVLSYKNRAARDTLGLWLQELKAGNMLNLAAQDPVGNEIMGRFNMRNEVINRLRNGEIKGITDPNLIAQTDAKYHQLIMQNNNDRVNELVSWADARHIPPEYRQPISQAEISVVENSFKRGQNPANVLSVLGQYSKVNQMYVAQAMRKPEQRISVQGVALLPPETRPQDKIDFIAAQQSAAPEEREKEAKIVHKATDRIISTRIANNLKDSMKIVQRSYQRESAGDITNAMINTTLNYAKYMARQNGDYGLNDWKKYADEASKIYANSFQMQSGLNWMINPQQAPENLTHAEWDILAHHVISEGYARIKLDRPEFEFESARDRHPLTMVLSSTNDLQAVDGTGRVYYTMPFTTDMLPFAKEMKARSESEREAISRKMRINTSFLNAGEQ